MSRNFNEMPSNQNYYGLPGGNYGLIDKADQEVGASEVDLTENVIVSERKNLLFFDTRDCVGELSLKEAQYAFAYNVASDGKIEQFNEILDSNEKVNPKKLLQVVQRLNDRGIITGFPERNSDNIPWIEGNTIKFRLQKELKLVKSMEIANIVIPRDIIPMFVYFPGFISNCLPINLDNFISNDTEPSSTWNSPIPMTIEDFIDKDVQGISSNKLGGVDQTPLRYWRTFTGSNSMPDPHTPPPYQLWNPPQDNFSDTPWPFQPMPKKQQRIPSYTSKSGVIFSGYGLYDLDDFPPFEEIQINGEIIQVPLRKLLLKLIVPEGQFINQISAEELIENNIDSDFNEEGIVDNPLTQTGYGDYQRFMPGPGVGMNYQPNIWRINKSATIDLTCSTYDSDTGYIGPMPTPFPNFRGNCWGPYNRPGDRFQNNSLQLTVDELYLNGDLRNISGNTIIYTDYDPAKGPYTYKMCTINSKRVNDDLRFKNFEFSANPNIKNSMRVVYDGGFGAVYAYVGQNTSEKGKPGPIVTGGLPNTQYDGKYHKFNSEVWVTAKSDNPTNWEETLPGPKKPSIVKDENFNGWIYTWRNIFPWEGTMYVPSTAGGVGAMEYNDIDPDNPKWKRSEILNYTYGSSEWSSSPIIGQSNMWCIPVGDLSTFELVSNLPWGFVSTSSLTYGGTNYNVGDNVSTVNITGNGNDFTINILSVNLGVITSFEINDSGSGYIAGNTVTVIQENSSNDSVLSVDNATPIPDDVIPEDNIFHYMDPLASGPNNTFALSGLSQDFINGIDSCDPGICNNCEIPKGEYVFSGGTSTETSANGNFDPTPHPSPLRMLKCDFKSQISPESEWESSDKTCRPKDNARIKQLSNYISNRVSYDDLGSDKGDLINRLLKYKLSFISSIPNTDIVIKINQATRNIYTQSLNATVNHSNFNTPIRLNLGSASGTSNYVEDIQGSLADCSGCFWSHRFDPPLASLDILELSLFTYDGTPISIERGLGFLHQRKETSVFYSSPSSVIISSAYSKNLSKPYNPYLLNYTQRNLSLTFKFVTYHSENPGITEIIHKIPTNLTDDNEIYEDSDGNRMNFIPMASNVEEYC
jgi:hypothetical protein